MPKILALTKYLYMKYKVHHINIPFFFTFIVTLLCHFASLEDRLPHQVIIFL